MDSTPRTADEWTDVLSSKIEELSPRTKIVDASAVYDLEHMALLIHHQITRILNNLNQQEEFMFHMKDTARSHLFYLKTAQSLVNIPHDDWGGNHAVGQIHAFAYCARSVLDILKTEQFSSSEKIQEIMNERVFPQEETEEPC